MRGYRAAREMRVLRADQMIWPAAPESVVNGPPTYAHLRFSSKSKASTGAPPTSSDQVPAATLGRVEI